MNKRYKIYFVCFILFLNFCIGTTVKAATYVVSAVSSTGTETPIGTYTDYGTAKNAMNQYPSTESNVAVIRENGKIVNAKYAIVRLHTDTQYPYAENGNNEHRLYPTSTSSSVHTTVHAAYGADAAFLNYDPVGGTHGRFQIKISGYTGWMNAPYATVVPISQLESSAWIASLDASWLTEINASEVKVVSAPGISIRTNHTTSSTIIGRTTQGTVYRFTDKYFDGTYTWYQVKLTNSSLKTYYEHYSTGCLIHYYATHNSQGWTNLGLAPSFLKKGSRYYSFDGNYYYESISAMLDDYKENTHKRAVNKDNIYYPYYLYLPVHSKTRYTANDFNQGIINKGYTSKSTSAMYGEGIHFIASQHQYGVNALLTFSAAINESATGTSKIALYKNNLFGHNAYGADPYGQATTYASVADGIMAHAKMTGQSYSNPYDERYYGGHYGNKQSGMNVKYATDPYWGEKAAMNAFLTDHSFGLQEWNGSTIGVTMQTGVIVRKKPSASGEAIYPLKNNYTGANVSHMPLTVVDRVYQEGKYWYKVYTDPALNSNQDLDWSGTYDFQKSFGYIAEDALYVSNSQPVITAKDITISKGADLNLLKGVQAYDKEDGDLTGTIQVSGTVYTKIPGTYEITYSVADYQQFQAHKTIKVVVKGEVEPTITASDREVTQYTSFDPMDGVRATDDIEGDITSKVQIVSNTVDITKTGIYKVVYAVTNNQGKRTTKEISVTVVLNEKPVIEAEDREVPLHSAFNPLDGIRAYDKEDGNITTISVLENTVDTSKMGSYTVTYQVQDTANQKTTKTITVCVKEKVLEKKDAKYYLDYIKNVDGKLQLKGYHAITGIHNNKEIPITYTLMFVDVDTEKVIFKQKANRILDKKEMSIPVFSNDGYDYTYSWFVINVDLENLPEGNYKMYIVSETDAYYAKSIVNNKIFAPQLTSFHGDKDVLIRNNYTTNDAPIEFVVRKEKIADRNTPTYSYNQFDQFLDLSFTSDSKLHLMGTSYSYGLDLSKQAKVTRTIVFEEKNTYKKYHYALDSITDGPYAVALPVSDSLDKIRAWYDKNIDIRNIEVGTYTIYISNSSNISDVSEFKDLLNRNVSTITKNIGSKKYSFQLNKKNNNIELVVQ